MKIDKTKRMRIMVMGVPFVLLSAALFAASQKRREVVNLFAVVPGTERGTPLSSSMWRSPTEVVILSKGAGGTTLISVDARTGKHKRLAPPPANNSIFGNFGVMVSPDGKWILWPGGMSGWSAMRLDGNGFVQRPRATQSTAGLRVAWLPDSSGWVESSAYGLNGRNGDTVLIIYKLKTPRTRVIAVPEADGINDFQVTQKGEAVFSCSEPVSVRFVTVPLSGPRKVRELDIAPPFNAGNKQHVVDTLVSPQGDRIAWTSQISKGGSTTESVWLSDIDGKNFKRLSPELDKYALAPVYLHWRPDGKSLSCWRHDSLNVMKVR